jgi:hypothetical protein
MVYNVGCLGNAFKLLSGFSGTKLPKNVEETVTSTNGSALWEQLQGGRSFASDVLISVKTSRYCCQSVISEWIVLFAVVESHHNNILYFLNSLRVEA